MSPVACPDIQGCPEQLPLLLIDNYDSYSFNLYSLCANINFTPIVIRNDQFDWESFKRDILPHFYAIIISPGPGSPKEATDVGISHMLLKDASVPILGVCLGHQSFAHVYGGNVVSAKPPMHGRLSEIFHNGKGLFRGIPSPFSAVRYHSLIVSRENLPSMLNITATSNNDEDIMSLQHGKKPIWSLQFHPEVQITNLLISVYLH